jgi:hypothetical protein
LPNPIVHKKSNVIHLYTNKAFRPTLEQCFNGRRYFVGRKTETHLKQFVSTLLLKLYNDTEIEFLRISILDLLIFQLLCRVWNGRTHCGSSVQSLHFAVFDPPDDGVSFKKICKLSKICAILQNRQYHYFVGCVPFWIYILHNICLICFLFTMFCVYHNYKYVNITIISKIYE